MKQPRYLMDTHAVIFWQHRIEVSDDFIEFFDKQAALGRLYVSSISFWEMALLVHKKRIQLDDVQAWKDELLDNSGVQLLDPTANEMIASVQLPFHHKDPFDRVLITQAIQQNLLLVTRDQAISLYAVDTHWIP